MSGDGGVVIPPDFDKTFIRHYLEHKAELAGQDPKSVTQQQLDQFHEWTKVCIVVCVRRSFARCARLCHSLV